MQNCIKQRPTAIICSPYGGLAENVNRARGYMCLAAEKGFVPLASHVMMYGLIDDADPEQRTLGMTAGLRMIAVADVLMVVITKDGITPGMQIEILMAIRQGVPIVYVNGDLDELNEIADPFLEIVEEFKGKWHRV